MTFKLFKSRNFGLDVLRSTSIILVILSHYFYYEKIELGVIGVEFFFVLSGYLIGQIIINDFAQGVSWSKILHFWKRRWYRTLPLYYLILIFKYVFFDHSLGYKIVVYFFFLQNNFVGLSFWGVSWSLVIEEWFYFTLPFLFLFFFRNGINGKKLLFFLIGIIFFELIIRVVWVYFVDRPFVGIRGNFPFRFDSLAFGVLLATVKIYFNKTYALFAHFIFFFSSLLLIIFLTFSLGKIGNINFYANTAFWTRTFWFSFMGLGVFFIIPYLEQSHTIAKIGDIHVLNFFFTWTSIFTYCFYLIHMLIFEVDLKIKNQYVEFAVYVLLLYLISSFLYFFYEKPLTNLRDKKSLLN